MLQGHRVRTLNFDLLSRADQFDHPRMSLTGNSYTPFSFQRLDHVRQLSRVDRNRRLSFERFDEIRPFVTFRGIRRSEQSDDFTTKIGSQLALMCRLSTEQVEIDESGERIRLKANKGMGELDSRVREEIDEQQIPSRLLE